MGEPDSGLSEHLAGILRSEVVRVEPISGGDINQARKLTLADGGALFMKYNDAPQASDNFAAEVHGLELLRQAGTLHIPRVLGTGRFGSAAYLLLEFVHVQSPTAHHWKRCGEGLAAIHARPSSRVFGLDRDNFIGSLPQSNAPRHAWPAFFREARLLPQWSAASSYFSQGDFALWESVIRKLDDLLPDAVPQLIHGDLWGGNVIFSAEGPWLIDPAVCHALGEMDIAMTRLFGGFPPDFYAAYFETLPGIPGWQERLPLYQLYYLLVHVNLFGMSYVPGVRRILEHYA